MKRTTMLLFGIIVTLIAGCSGGKNVEQITAATAAADKWLAVADQGRFEDTWDEGSSSFKLVMSKEKWAEVLRVSLEPLGKITARRLTAKQYTTTVPEMPEGEYVLLEYAATCENSTEKQEVLTVQKEADGTWRVASYYIK